MLLDFLGSVMLFAVLTFGLAWPVASRLALEPAEKLLATAGFSVVGIFLAAWAIYVFALPTALLWGLPLLAVAALAAHYRAFATFVRNEAVGEVLVSQLLVTLWCIGWLAAVTNYSGGGWAADWYEHWERTRFFLERWPVTTQFLGQYPLPARPPLANVVVAALLRLSRPDFAHYQLFSTLLASLSFLPAALLARHWGGRRAIAVLAVLFMVNPLFVQNATFAWTKLPAAFFVLGALWFFLRGRENEGPAASGLACALFLAAGILTHYSAGPYVIVIAVWWFVAGRRHWHTPEWRSQTALMGLGGALLLATWFGWSASVLGAEQTFLSNTSVTSENVRQGDQFTKIGLNIFDTVVPHFLRNLDPSLIDQSSPWGHRRDWFFQAYQLNLPLAFGSLAWLVIMRELLRARREASRSAWTFWKAFVAATVFLGIAVHGARDHWGLAHICLQPLVLLGLAFLAGCWPRRSRRWHAILIAGAAFDLLFGIVLHFGVQNIEVFRRLAGLPSPDAAIVTLSPAAIMNYAAKLQHGLAFFPDAFPLPRALLAALLTGLIALAAWRSRRLDPTRRVETPAHAIPIGRF